MTKGSTNPLVWERVRSLIGIIPLKDKSNSYGTNTIKDQVDPGTLLNKAVGNKTIKQQTQDRLKDAGATSRPGWGYPLV
eukprot:12019764-Heterocapsa_arctica.AAC.1